LSLFRPEVSVVYYDLTTLYFESEISEKFHFETVKVGKRLAGVKRARLVAYLPLDRAEPNVYSGQPPMAKGWPDLLTTGEAAYLWVP